MDGPRLENVLPREGISSSPEHPLEEFAWLVGGVAVALAVVVFIVGWGAQWLAPRLPFAAEESLAARWFDQSTPREQWARTSALQSLADRVAAEMQLPRDMHVRLSVGESVDVNAFATIGGRIRVNRGLLQQLNSEDALAALLAHEIAHVKHRHVAASLGRGLALSVLLAAISSDAGAASAQAAIGNATGMALLGYSRAQEVQADEDALRAVVALYGHAGGFAELFAVLRVAQADHPGGALAATHPLTVVRISRARAQARAQGWPATGALTPLAASIRWPRTAALH